MKNNQAEYFAQLKKQNKELASYHAKMEQQRGTYKPKCPTCGSTDIKRIGDIERGVSVGAFGLASSKINKTFKCKNCGYTW